MRYDPDRLRALRGAAQLISKRGYGTQEATQLRLRLANELRTLRAADFSGGDGRALTDLLIETARAIAEAGRDTAPATTDADPTPGPRHFALNPEDLRTIEPARRHRDWRASGRDG
ncbi:hypothetical protein JK358_04950 [Nocardia sp. 2]|uniref:DivIVA domain-containing protein n=1 Tax=Nocardia acididurans TaxID=2802282 RepID=A0ABS1M1N4_9NOCA|nr:hypothetical protein [Nocardia acididurans]MBL1073734.1 hypothetical protein [Nocardia acididurans]